MIVQLDDFEAHGPIAYDIPDRIVAEFASWVINSQRARFDAQTLHDKAMKFRKAARAAKVRVLPDAVAPAAQPDVAQPATA